MNWRVKTQIKAYKRGYMRGLRMCKYKPRAGATELARQVMINEINRDKQRLEAQARLMLVAKKNPVPIGNEEWRKLA